MAATVARDGSIVPLKRRMGPTFDTDKYSKGDPIYMPKHLSPAAMRFKAVRLARRAAARAGK